MPKTSNTELLAHIDCAGGGQVWVDGRTLYIGHMNDPSGTMSTIRKIRKLSTASKCPKDGIRTKFALPTES